MPLNLKLFEWLIYGAAAVDMAGTLAAKSPFNETVYSLLVWVAMIALAWAAARRRQRWAAFVMLALGVLLVVGFITAWIFPDFPETPLTTIDTVTGLVSIAMLLVAFYFYFFGARQSA